MKVSKATGVEGIPQNSCEEKKEKNGNQQDIHIWVRSVVN